MFDTLLDVNITCFYNLFIFDFAYFFCLIYLLPIFAEGLDEIVAQETEDESEDESEAQDDDLSIDKERSPSTYSQATTVPFESEEPREETKEITEEPAPAPHLTIPRAMNQLAGPNNTPASLNIV